MKNETKGNWDRFFPKTNIMWMHYLIDKILVEKKTLPKAGALAQLCRESLISLQNNILSYNSASEFVNHEIVLKPQDSSNFFNGCFSIKSNT